MKIQSIILPLLLFMCAFHQIVANGNYTGERALPRSEAGDLTDATYGTHPQVTVSKDHLGHELGQSGSDYNQSRHQRDLSLDHGRDTQTHPTGYRPSHQGDSSNLDHGKETNQHPTGYRPTDQSRHQRDLSLDDGRDTQKHPTGYRPSHQGDSSNLDHGRDTNQHPTGYRPTDQSRHQRDLSLDHGRDTQTHPTGYRPSHQGDSSNLDYGRDTNQHPTGYRPTDQSRHQRDLSLDHGRDTQTHPTGYRPSHQEDSSNHEHGNDNSQHHDVLTGRDVDPGFSFDPSKALPKNQ